MMIIMPSDWWEGESDTWLDNDILTAYSQSLSQRYQIIVLRLIIWISGDDGHHINQHSETVSQPPLSSTPKPTEIILFILLK